MNVCFTCKVSLRNIIKYIFMSALLETVNAFFVVEYFALYFIFFVLLIPILTIQYTITKIYAIFSTTFSHIVCLLSFVTECADFDTDGIFISSLSSNGSLIISLCDGKIDLFLFGYSFCNISVVFVITKDNKSTAFFLYPFFFNSLLAFITILF